MQWSEQGIIASYKFIQKLWLLHQKIKKKISLTSHTKTETNKISEFTNQLIDKVTKNLEKFNYNVIIANFYETYNFLIKEIDHTLETKDLLTNYKKVLYLMIPFIPHFAYECLENLQETNENKWPRVNKKFLKTNNITIVIQINGKKKSIINTISGINEEKLIKQIREDEKMKKILENKSINRTIFIKDKLINLIVK